MITEASIKSSDLLYLSILISETTNARGVILIVPGINEHKKRYMEMINYFNSNNYHVLVYDQRGHGKSINNENNYGVIIDANKLIEDLKIIEEYTYNRYSNLPIYIIGDSLGGLVTINFLPQKKYVKKVVLTSPIYHKNNEINLKISKYMLKIMGVNKESSYFQSLLGFDNKSVLIKDINEYEKLKKDNLAFYNYKNGSIYQIFRLEDNIKRLNYDNIDLLMLAGSCDKTFSGKENVYTLANILSSRGINNIKYLEYHNMGHKILFEPGRKLVYQEIKLFLES